MVLGTDQLNNNLKGANCSFFILLLFKISFMKTKFASLLFALAVFTSCLSQEKKGVQLVTPTEFSKKVASEKGQIIDVRTPKEFEQGHLENAQNIHLYDQDFAQRIDKLDKKQPVYVYCKAGGRSAEAVEIMQNHGFETIIEMQGGTDSWAEAKLPLKQ